MRSSRKRTQRTQRTPPVGTHAAERDAAAPPQPGRPVPWLLSGRSPEALRAQGERLLGYLRERPDITPADVGLALATTRSAFEHRTVVTGASRAELTDGLESLVAGVPAASIQQGLARGSSTTAFLFTGQGAQRIGMGRGLYGAFPVFAGAFDAVCAELDPHLDHPLATVLAGEAADLDQTAYTQPALFALEVALFRLLESWQITPDYLAGHSVGELSAAHVSGVLSLADAAALVAARGRLMQALPEGGAMVAVSAPEAEVLPLLTDQVSVAAVNGAASVVISGEINAVLAVAAGCEARGHRSTRLRVSHAFHSPLMEPMLADFRKIAERMSYAVPGIPIVSCLTGELATDAELRSPEYWVRHVRGTVRFHDAARCLESLGVNRFAEIGPDGVLSALTQEALTGAPGHAVVVPVLRRDQPEELALTGALARLHVRGLSPDWAAYFGHRPARPDLPTYPFQRKTYWLASSPADGDPASLGLEPVNHPLLHSATRLADSGALVLSGRLPAATGSWLADHAVGGSAVFPGTAFVELAIRAGDQAGCPQVRELTVHAPLVLPASGAVRMQVSVGAPGESGERPVSIYSCPDEGTGNTQWVRHATGLLDAGSGAAPPELAEWPPAGAEPVDLTGLYDAMAEQGLAYGPVFRGLRSAWRRDDEVFAEVGLPEQERLAAADFGLHPAVLDAALHAIGLTGIGGDGLWLPYAWSGVDLLASGAAAARVRIRPAGAGSVSLVLADPAGQPVASVGSLTLRPVPAGTLAAAAGPAPNEAGGALFRVDWRPVTLPTVAAGDASPVPDLGTLDPAAPAPALAALQMDGGTEPEAVRTAVHRALAAVLPWLADERFASSQLAVLTTSAATVNSDDPADLAGAAVRGLVRSAQAEHPGRLILVDTDGQPAALGLLPAIAAAGEPEVAVRGTAVWVPRLAPVPASPAAVPPAWAGDGTVLISGGTGALGRLVARHLVERHGVRRLLLVSRRGHRGRGVRALQRELAAFGAEAEVAACDLGSRPSAERLLSGRRLTAVIHAAGTLDDGVLSSLTPERIDAVLRPKVDAAWHLHELTKDQDLAAFVLFSSAAGVLGAPGQASYAAANSYLDALAAHRRTQGLPAQSLAWGQWSLADGMGPADPSAPPPGHRAAMPAITAPEGLGLFETASGLGEPALVPVKLDLAVLRDTAWLPKLLHGLVPQGRRAAAPGRPTGDSLRDRLHAQPPAERLTAAQELVRGHAAAVLGYGPAELPDVDRPFTDLGFDSLTAVELRNRLSAATEMPLPPTLVFDYPTVMDLGAYLLDALLGTAADREEPAALIAAHDDEPIAIVGMACRFPGGASSPEQLWTLVAGGGDGIAAFPANRSWDMDYWQHALDASGRDAVGGFVADATDFDAGFFGISPNEAVMMDPQQRMLLETCWEALERAGIEPSSLRKSATGVFAGVMESGYDPGPALTLEHNGMFRASGALASIVSGRVAYTLGLEGPAVSVDTACSSSLVALHLAGQALRQGDCSLALAGGVTVVVSPDQFAYFDESGTASDGRCKAFSATADGVGWAEGAGVLVVERLSDARRHGHEVLAVVRASAVTQDGASNGLTAPNGAAQERVIRQALARAGLSAAEVDAVEGHGTGTTLGDPIELNALLATYGQDRPPDRPLWLGSVKSNIGHTQAAAGVAGIIKMVLAMRHGELPMTRFADAPTRHVDWSSGHVRLLAETIPWPAADQPRRAGISSFGLSGTNAHVILEQPPLTAEPATEPVAPAAAAPVTEPPGGGGPALPWLLSARTREALPAQADRLLAHIADQPELDALDIGSALASRPALPYRAAITGPDGTALLAGLTALARGEPYAGVLRGTARSAAKTAFLFPGQGSQRPGMGAGLHAAFPAFARSFDEVSAGFDRYLDRPLREVMFAAEGSVTAQLLDQTVFTQAALFTMQVALFRLLESWGQRPDFLLGHSVGELAVAHVAGVLPLKDAIRLTACRGQLMQEMPAGAVVAIEASEEEVRPLLGERVSIAAINGPASVVIAGAEQPILELAEHWAERNRRTRRLIIRRAIHSPLMDDMLDELRDVATGLHYALPRLPVVAAVTGEPVTAGELGDPGYWVANCRQPVRFLDGIRALQSAGIGRYLELGGGALSAMAQSCLAGEPGDAVVVPAVRPDRPESAAVLQAAAQLWASGGGPDPARLFTGRGARPVTLPPYAFHRTHYWTDVDMQAVQESGGMAAAGLEPTAHPLAGGVMRLADSGSITLTGRAIPAHPSLAGRSPGRRDHGVSRCGVRRAGYPGRR